MTDSSSSQSPPDNSSRSSQNSSSGPAKVDHADTDWARWKNWANSVLHRYDGPARDEYVRVCDDHNEEADIKRCEDSRDWLLQYSPQVRFMQEKIRKLGGDLHSGNIRCMKCTAFKASGFDPDYGIQLCSNRSKSRSEVEDCLAHEMIHAYDHLRFNVDWDTNLKHAACTEIRASSLSGECRFFREYFVNPRAKFVNQHQACVRRRAQLSLMARPICKSEREAAKAVNETWESCFADTRPFDEIYR